MIELKKNQMSNLVGLYKDCTDSTVWSCLQGCQGRAWADCVEKPTTARIYIGDFCFLGGCLPEDPMAYLMDFPDTIDVHKNIYVAQSNAWSIYLKHAEELEEQTRYAMKKEANHFDKIQLLNYINLLPSNYSIVPIDDALYTVLRSNSWSEAFVFLFEDAMDFVENGMGYVILDQGMPIAGASSYSYYKEGIEIEIITHSDYRRQGLALIVGAKLILECINQNKYPNWDAANMMSCKIAEKLGYHFDHKYPVYVLKIC